MPVTLETIRTFSCQRIKLSSTFECPMLGALLQSPNGQVCGLGGDVAFEQKTVLFFKPFFRICCLIVIGLQSASVRAVIWVEDRPIFTDSLLDQVRGGGLLLEFLSHNL